ncbi:MAG: hypothetical protein Q4C96_07930 [Planctomycetia bacterium]|nr:hypothetical protein [Planctomycetia bacterium]
MAWEDILFHFNFRFVRFLKPAFLVKQNTGKAEIYSISGIKPVVHVLGGGHHVGILNESVNPRKNCCVLKSRMKMAFGVSETAENGKLIVRQISKILK